MTVTTMRYLNSGISKYVFEYILKSYARLVILARKLTDYIHAALSDICTNFRGISHMSLSTVSQDQNDLRAD